ncbi:XrtA/PEP-CTERM system histidine kinase PrsK [Rhodocyclus tenuis]|uniref:XrtA/PEP-CTERM system histidine kinase PrsK n=1 Tax=Rhodocyclus tenuis TaxID=1066 RepID=UPI001905C139|nr:XrtA/PEP-CTERM system histidine kinase PrsK [Rhodocyclus tenuis]MBK1679314.1 histidine kinase [Rhodocyclus tenuis]
MNTESASLIVWSSGLAAGAYALLSTYLLSLGDEWRSGKRSKTMLLAVALSALWAALTAFALSSESASAALLASLADICRHGAWYAFLIFLLIPPTQAQARKAITVRGGMVAACVAMILAGIALQLSLAFGWLIPEQWLRLSLFHSLAMPVLALVLIEQLFRAVADDSLWNVKPLCLGLAGQFIFDIYLFSDALMFSRIDGDALVVRGFIHALTTPLLVLATLRSRNWTSKIRLSQKAAFHSVTLLIAGLYLLFMAGIGYYVRYFGGDWGRALQLGLVCAAILGLGVLGVSGAMRAKLRVLVGKHLFSYRYDYREEWLRFTHTLSAEDSPQGMGQQVIRGLANMVESPAGTLWLRDASNESYRQNARWNVPECSSNEAANSSLTRFLLDSGWIINLEEYRCHPSRYRKLEIPDWLSHMANAWLVVPLMVGNEMIGFVILASSRTTIDVNWEVNDLLRTAGCQAAGFLARMQATEALLEARKFDAFNKMSAFVVHDLKNIVTQLALMLRNAERHRDNPEFQEDMLMTVGHSVERMRQLMMQLREGATPPGTACGVSLPELIQRIQKEKMDQGRPVELVIQDRLATRGHENRLERVIGHLVQNALDATDNSGKVWISLKKKGDRAALEIGDSGHGMSPEFIRERLFKPFQSTKQAGMGIGAYESSQYIRELGGEMHVDSQVGEGTRITLMLPLFELRTASDLGEKEAA